MGNLGLDKEENEAMNMKIKKVLGKFKQGRERST